MNEALIHDRTPSHVIIVYIYGQDTSPSILVVWIELSPTSS